MAGMTSSDGRFVYYSDPAEQQAALAAYTGDGPYPVLGTGPDASSPGTRPGQADRNVPGMVPAPPPPPAATAPPGPIPGAPSQTRPWYMNFDNPTLMQMLRDDPSMRSRFPREVILGFPNEFFLQNPTFQDLLPPDRRATFGGGVLPPPPSTVPVTPAVPSPSTVPVKPTVPVMPVAGTPPPAPAQTPRPAATPTAVQTPARPGGFPVRDEEAGWIKHNPAGLPTLVMPGVGEAPLTPRVAEAIAGRPLSPLRQLGNLPRFAPQTLANMPASEREALGVLANKTGNFAEDFFEQSRRMGQMVGGGGFGGVAGAPRRR